MERMQLQIFLWMLNSRKYQFLFVALSLIELGEGGTAAAAAKREIIHQQNSKSGHAGCSVHNNSSLSRRLLQVQGY